MRAHMRHITGVVEFHMWKYGIHSFLWGKAQAFPYYVADPAIPGEWRALRVVPSLGEASFKWPILLLPANASTQHRKNLLQPRSWPPIGFGNVECLSTLHPSVPSANSPLDSSLQFTNRNPPPRLGIRASRWVTGPDVSVPTWKGDVKARRFPSLKEILVRTRRECPHACAIIRSCQHTDDHSAEPVAWCI